MYEAIQATICHSCLKTAAEHRWCIVEAELLECEFQGCKVMVFKGVETVVQHTPSKEQQRIQA